jgi:phosphoribosyl-ATP pyrophosphohydrolase
MSKFSLQDLEEIIASRADVTDGSSWTAKLVSGGVEKASKKFGEEAFETVIAALKETDTDLIGESADLLYHLLVVLHVRGVKIDAVLDELARRTQQSGIVEKASRPQ